MNSKFYICNHCGNIIGFIKNAGVKVKCCNEDMKELIPNTVDASKEKHVPVVKITDNIIKVKIGEVEHPMEEAHHIAWVYVETEKGGMRKALKVNEKPEVTFSIVDDKVLRVYAYCNLHGLWMVEV